MGRFGEFKAQFFARGNLNTPLSDGASIVRVPISGSTSAIMNGMGRTELTFGHDELIGNLIAEGNICICYQYDALIPEYLGGTPFCLPFEIESVTPAGPGLLRIEGPDLLDQLLDTQHFSPIGGGTETNTTVAVAVSDPAATTVAVGAPQNNDSITLSSTTGWQVGDEARIVLDNGGLHVTVVKTVNPEGAAANTIQIVDRLPFAAGVANTVTRRRRRVQVAAGQGAAFQAGVECRLTLDDNTVHTTLIAEEPEGDLVTMKDGAPDGAAVGKAIKATNYSQPTTSDVTKIMSYMAGWTTEFEGAVTGTEAGTRHAPRGDSVYDLLVATAKATGEFFRLKSAGQAAAPLRTVQWRRTFDYAGQGANLRLVQPTQATIDTEAANVNRGIITGDVEREGVFQPVTRVVPLAGDKRITLKLCSEESRLQAMVEGLTLVDTGLGLYTPPYLYNAAAELAMGMIARTVTFSQVRVETDNAAEWTSAADQLVRLAIAYLYEHGTGVRYRYTVPDIVTAIPVAPGQRVEMVYTSPDGRWSVNRTGANALYVLEVRAAFSPPDEDANGNLNDRGKLVTLVMAEDPWDIPDVATATAAAIAEAGRIARIASGEGMMGATSIIMGGGGGGGTDDHGELTGLADDDHPQYLRADGTRALTANWAVNSNVTIDGVDISAHAANPAAHHAPVTATNSSIALSGQAVSVALSTPATLAVTTGLGVLLNATGGIDVNAGLQVKLPANSGIARDATGLYLSPSTLTAATTNAVAAAGHTHAVTATDNAKTTPAQLLKTTAAGNLTLAVLTADRLIAPILESTGAITLDPATSLIYADGNLSFVGARQIVTDSGALTLAPAQTLIFTPADGVAQMGTNTTLRTAHAAVGVFPQTGWQVNYNGNGYFTSLLADELHVQSFIADIMRVKVGGEYIPESMALISRNFTIPGVGATGQLYVEDVPGWGAIPVFADGDWVLVRVVNRDNGGLIVANAWGQVTGYADQGNGEQRWTFTTRIATSAVGQTARRGDLALDYGKSGSAWWYVTVLDRAGPHAGFGRWTGNNPTEGVQYPIRLGQLEGVTGVTELGLQVGLSTGARMKFSDYGGEIHGSRLSLYAGDSAQLRVAAATVLLYTTVSANQALVPNADHSSLRVVSSLGTYYQAIDEAIGSPNYTDYIANGPNSNGFVYVGLTNPTFSNIHSIVLSYAVRGELFVNDTARLYGQVFKADETTPLTGEVLVSTQTANGNATGTVTLPHDDAATQTDWANARLRLRWEYQINANEEAIRLDPSIPSLAVGNPLPTAADGGGDGLWVGLNSGVYKLRLGKANGVGLHWTGTAVELRNSNNQPTITLDASGNSRFDGAMTIGANGGIWQGTGTFAAPTTGLKIYNSDGVGRLSTYNGGLEQVTINTAGQLTAGQGAVIVDRVGVRLIDNAPGAGRPSEIRFQESISSTQYGYIRGAAGIHEFRFGVQTSPSTSHYMAVTSDGIALKNAGSYGGTLLVSNGGVVINTESSPFDALGVVGSASITSNGKIGGGLAVGSQTAAPDAGALFLNARTSTVTVWPGGGQLYVQTVGGVQKLYVKFGNGTVRELASA